MIKNSVLIVKANLNLIIIDIGFIIIIIKNITIIDTDNYRRFNNCQLG